MKGLVLFVRETWPGSCAPFMGLPVCRFGALLTQPSGIRTNPAPRIEASLPAAAQSLYHRLSAGRARATGSDEASRPIELRRDFGAPQQVGLADLAGRQDCASSASVSASPRRPVTSWRRDWWRVGASTKRIGPEGRQLSAGKERPADKQGRLLGTIFSFMAAARQKGAPRCSLVVVVVGPVVEEREREREGDWECINGLLGGEWWRLEGGGELGGQR